MIKRLFLLLFAFYPLLAGAVLTIEITQGVEGALPIAVPPFQGASPLDIAGVVRADLARSGRFRPMKSPSPGVPLDLTPFRERGAESLVVGEVKATPQGYEVSFRLFDAVQGEMLLGHRFAPVPGTRLRAVAHRISDMVYEKLLGEPGAFSTRIAYIAEEGGRYALKVADADGYNDRTVLESEAPLLSPAWSPDGRDIAYVSLEGEGSQVFIQDLATGKRRRVSAYPGLNSAPAFSPDGRYLALTLSKDGDPEIYLINIATRRLRRLTDNPAIDTEPAFSPDGRYIYFTSDRGGTPQIYRIPREGGEARRITFEGDYNASPDVSPDGRALALVHRSRGRYRIALLDLDTLALSELTEGPLDESPSFAPNGSMILYSVHGGTLAAVSRDGRVRQRLLLSGGDAREPAWSPFLEEMP